jgi:glycosyltransferase involved in cell wall biosynthesis
MRILHISKYYYPYIGGVENICKYIVDNSGDHQVAVLCFNEGRKDVVEQVNGITVYRVATWVNVARQALSLSYFPMMRRAIKEFMPDVIHFHWANPFPAAVLLTIIPKDVKLIIHWHMDIIKQKHIYPLIRPIEARLLKRASCVVVTSPQYREGSIPLQSFKEKVRIVPNSMEENNFVLRAGDQVQIQKIKEKYQKKIVFFIGRHIQYKGLPWLLEAEKYVKKDCVFVIAGGGPLTEELKASCKSNRVHFIGRLSDDELRWYHYAASVFAFPSITKNEAFGVALAEAMYCYTPAVTFTIPGSGVNWVNLNNVTGLEVPNGDSKAFAEAIEKLLSDEGLAEKYAKAGHLRIIENFTIPKMIAKMNEVYNEV